MEASQCVTAALSAAIPVNMVSYACRESGWGIRHITRRDGWYVVVVFFFFCFISFSSFSKLKFTKFLKASVLENGCILHLISNGRAVRRDYFTGWIVPGI